MTVYYTASNVTRPGELMHYINYASGGTFGISMLIVIFFVSFLAMRGGTQDYRGVNAKIFAASSFITMVFAVMFFILGVVTSLVMYVTFILVALSVFANVVGGE